MPLSQNFMIHQCLPGDIYEIYTVINEAARAYSGVIPVDCYHEPYMPMEELKTELQQMSFFGWEDGGKLTGVMGFQPVKDVTLIRHAYVLPGYQRRGIGSKLLDYLIKLTITRILLVGTWADVWWAIKFYEKYGFRLLPDKDQLLKTYWQISERQIQTSVVLGLELTNQNY